MRALGRPMIAFFPFTMTGRWRSCLCLSRISITASGLPTKSLGVELELLELRVLAHQVLDRVFESGDDLLQRLPVRRGLDVEDDLVFHSQFLGDRQGIRGGSSVRVVVDRDLGHEGLLRGNRGEVKPGLAAMVWFKHGQR